MLRPDNPYLYAVVAVVSFLASAVVDDEWSRLLLVALSAASAAVCVWLLVRQRRDPNGPAGQH